MSSVALGEVVQIKGGGTPSKRNPDFYTGDIPWVTPKDMKVWEISDAIDKITPEAIEKSATNLIPKSAILLVNRSGILKHTLPVGITRRPVAINQDMKALICSDRAHPEYLAHLVKAAEPHVLKWVRATTADNFPIQNLAKMEIPLPPLEEQRRIAAILDQADALRRLRRRAIDRLNTLGQAIFHEMFGTIGTSDLPTRPFGEFAEIKLGKMLDKGKFKGGETMPYLRNVNVRWFEFDLSDVLEMEFAENELERFRVKPGDLLICEGGEPGRCAVWQVANRDIYYQKALHRVRLDKRVATPNYIAFWFYVATQSSNLSDFVSAATIAHLTGAKIKTLPIMLPTIQEQTLFEQRLEQVSLKRTVLSRARQYQEDLFESLQHRAFRGEL